jgi:type I restriction enzyme S subunit
MDGPFGSKLKTEHYTDNGPRVVRLGNIQPRRFSDEDRAFISNEYFKQLRAHEVHAGDLLIAALGDPLGRTCRAPDDLGPAIVKADCLRYRCGPSVEADYLLYWLNSPEGRKRIEALSHGIGRKRINTQDLRRVTVPLPPLPDQRRIVAKLDGLFARTNRAREQLARVPVLVERYKQSLLQTALNGGLTHNWRLSTDGAGWAEDEHRQVGERRQAYVAGRRGARLRDAPPLIIGEDPELPASWMCCCLADVADLRTGYAFKSAWFATEGPKLLRGANIAPGRLQWDDTKFLSPAFVSEFEEEYRLSAGDIVIAMDRPLISGGLKVAIVEPEDDGALLVQRVASPVCSRLLAPKFLWYLLNSRIFVSHIEKHATGSDLPHISSNDILTTPVPLPPVEEQLKIVSLLDVAFAALSRQLAETVKADRLLDRLDQAALAKAFRGELALSDSNQSSSNNDAFNFVEGGLVVPAVI